MSTHDAIIDLSHYQPSVTFTRVAGAGIRVVICKATEGRGVDESYARRPGLITSTGMRPGAYHFLRKGDPVGQVRHFLDVVKPTPGAILCVDWEKALDKSCATLDEAYAALTALAEEGRTTPILYSYGSLLNKNVPVGHPIAEFPLWLASIGKGEVRPKWSASYQIGPLPNAWAAHPERVLAWQYSWTGSVDGVPGACDRSVADVDAMLLRWPGSVT